MSYTFRYDTPGGLFCGHCLQHSASLKTDKRGRPYLVCAGCLSRSFIHSDRGLIAVRTMSQAALARLRALAEAIDRDAAHKEYAQGAEAALQRAASGASDG